MIISLTGMPGSGKSTIAKLLSQKLSVPWYSVGDLRGKMAKEHGMTIDELNTLGETEAFTDKDVDEYQTKLGFGNESFIIDGRLSWHFIPQSLKVFLSVDPDIAAARIFGASKAGKRADEKAYTSSAEVKQAIADRVASDQLRYQKYYQIDYLDLKNYDLIIDTTRLTPEMIVRQILSKIPA